MKQSRELLWELAVFELSFLALLVYSLACPPWILWLDGKWIGTAQCSAKELNVPLTRNWVKWEARRGDFEEISLVGKLKSPAEPGVFPNGIVALTARDSSVPWPRSYLVDWFHHAWGSVGWFAPEAAQPAIVFDGWRAWVDLVPMSHGWKWEQVDLEGRHAVVFPKREFHPDPFGERDSGAPRAGILAPPDGDDPEEALDR